MALFNWICEQCGFATRQILDARPPEGPLCPKGHRTVAKTQGSTSVMEVLDNGLMPRRVERYRDINELRKSHAEIQPLTQGDKPEII